MNYLFGLHFVFHCGSYQKPLLTGQSKGGWGEEGGKVRAERLRARPLHWDPLFQWRMAS